MRVKTKVITLAGIIVCCGLIATTLMVQEQDGRPAADGQMEVTFRLTSLTKTPYYLQHGIYTILTLNMIEEGGEAAFSIDDPPQFPLTATIDYQTVDGQKRKVSSAYGYRC
jgi:hypothetical protein